MSGRELSGRETSGREMSWNPSDLFEFCMKVKTIFKLMSFILTLKRVGLQNYE